MLGDWTECDPVGHEMGTIKSNLLWRFLPCARVFDSTGILKSDGPVYREKVTKEAYNIMKDFMKRLKLQPPLGLAIRRQFGDDCVAALIF